MLEFRNLSFAYPGSGKTILRNINFTLKHGDFVMMLGANGSGKSTLLKLANGRLQSGGSVILNGQPVPEISPGVRAGIIAAVSQSTDLMPDFTVVEMVRMGRNPYLSRLGRMNENDEAAVASALEAMSLESLKHRYVNCLSGGEKQRVMIAAALARKTDFLLLDEPTAAADPAHRIGIIRTLKSLPGKPGILIATHDIAAAKLFAESLLLLHDGSVRNILPENLTEEDIRILYGNDAVCLLRSPEI